MEEELKNIELIEAYLENRLDESAKLEFENKLNSNGAFKQLYDDTLLLIEGINLSNREVLLDQLKEKESQLSDNVVQFRPAKKNNQRAAILSIAAVGLLLISSLFIFRIINQKGASSQLAAFKEPLPKQLLYNNVRGEQTSDEIRKKASELYSDEKYKEASQLLEELIYDQHDTALIIQKFYTNALLQGSKDDCDLYSNKFLRLENSVSTLNRKNLVLLDRAIWQVQCGETADAKKNLHYILQNSNQVDIKQKSSDLLKVIK